MFYNRASPNARASRCNEVMLYQATPRGVLPASEIPLFDLWRPHEISLSYRYHR